MPRPTKLSATFVKNCRTPGRYGDGRGGHGLSLLVKPMVAGGLSKTFSQRLRLNGKPIDIGLGSYPVITLEEARRAAIENTRAARGGIDPIADRRRRASIPTFRQAAEKVIETKAASWKGGRTEGIWRGRLERYAYPAIGEMRVDAITSSDLLAVIGPLWATKKETAAKTKSYLNAVFSWCIAKGHRTDNPVDAIRAALPRGGGQVEHHRALDWRDVGNAIRKVRESDAYPTTKICFEFLVLTASRSGEARFAEWREVDVDARLWTIPGSRTKSGREHRVPLSDAAMSILEEAGKFSDEGLIFPSPTGKAMSDSTASKLLRELGIGAVPHGFRSSFRDWCGETGQQREVAEAALAHTFGNAVEQAYARSDLFQRRRELMRQWADAITG